MSLGLALSSSLSSLKVNQESLSLISQNIANANSTDYTRRQISQTTQVLAGEAAGVQIEGTRRVVDDFIIASARRQISDFSKAEVRTEFFSRMQLLLGEPGNGNSINSYVDDFFNALNDLANSSDQVALRTNAVEEGERLALKISELAGNLEQTRFDIDKEIGQTVKDANTLLQDLFNLNKAIKENITLQGDSNALFDQRDVILSKISSILDVGVNFNGNGTATVFLPRGELVTGEEYFQLEYIPAPSVKSFVDESPLSGINIYAVDRVTGQYDRTRPSGTLVSATNDRVQEYNLKSGKLQGLLEMRDTEIPAILGQLDQLATVLQDTFNAIHNDGVGYPPATSLTGTNLIDPDDIYSMTGTWTIAALNADGTPASDPYSTNGEGKVNPLVIDLDNLITNAQGPGSISMASIMNEINSYYGVPHAKVVQGPLDDIRMAAVSNEVTIAAATATFSINTLPAVGSTITVAGQVYTFVNNVTAGNQIKVQLTPNGTAQEIARVLNLSNNTGVGTATYKADGNMVTATARTSGSGANGSFSLVSGSAAVTASGALAGGADASGQVVLDIEASNLSKFNDVKLTLQPSPPGPGITTNLPGVFDFDALSSTFTDLQVGAGGRVRSGDESGLNSLVFNITDIAGTDLQEGDEVEITIPVTVTQVDDTVVPSITTTYQDSITYKFIIPGAGEDIRNKRYDAVNTVNGGDTFVQPFTNQGYLKAELVDANGKPVAEGEEGYLRIKTLRAGIGVAIDENNSRVTRNLSDAGEDTKSFQLSHYLGLNDFFVSTPGEKNSAISLKVADRFDKTSNLSLASLTPSNQNADPSAPPVYTMEIGVASSQTGERLANLRIAQNAFNSAGTLPGITTTFSNYASEIISYSANRTNYASNEFAQQTTLRSAYTTRIDSVGGVNIDEELANTVLFQNNYNASARMITVVDELLQALIDAF